jgi:hypothetical protein
VTNIFKSPTLLFALAFSLISFAASAGEVQVQNAGPPSKTGVSISYLFPPTQLSLHEPIVINFQIKNETAEVVSLDLGQDRKGEFLFSVTSPDGTILHLPKLRHEGLSQYGSVSVQPGGTFALRLLLNEFYDKFNMPGKYKLEARLTTPIVVAGTLQLRDPGFKGEISITHRDPARLEKVCAELAKQVEVAPSVEAAEFPALELSYVEDPVAVLSLAQVLRSHTLNYNHAISGLERIGNDDAVEVLLSALDNKFGDIAELATAALARMQERIPDPSLKETVKKAVERSSARARHEYIKTQIAYLDYRDPPLQDSAIQNLMKVEDGLQQAEPVLQRLANDPNQPADVRAAARDALQKLHPPQR